MLCKKEEVAMTVDEHQMIEKIHSLVVVLAERQQTKEFYDIEEFARIVGRAVFTCREWARNGRILAAKKLSGRGAYSQWVVSNGELERYRREGLLPRK